MGLIPIRVPLGPFAEVRERHRIYIYKILVRQVVRQVSDTDD